MSAAVNALGPAPVGSQRSPRLGAQSLLDRAYREMYGCVHPDDPIGPEAGRKAPDQRAAWHQAFAADILTPS